MASSSTESRLRDLEQQIEELSADLRVLRGLVAEDHASALNKIRYVTEKVLHGLCAKHDVGWGKQEPTLENMIGPLIAGKTIPKNIAVHVRTIQTNASPGSHFQESALSATHVQVAQIALLELLEWYYQGAAMSGALPKVQLVEPPARTRRRLAIAIAGVAVAGGLAATVYLVASRGAAPPPAPPIAKAPMREPRAGLAAVEQYEHPTGPTTGLSSEPLWQAAIDDFALAAKQAGAPPRYRAGEHFARGLAVLRAQDATARDELHAAIAADPTWAASHDALAGVLAHAQEIDAALAEVHEAQRLEPQSWVWIATGARVYRTADKLADAINEYQRALTLAPKQPTLLAELAHVSHAAHLDTQAVKYAKEALALSPDLVEPHLVLAERALEAKDAVTAESEAELAYALAPHSVSAMVDLADAKLLEHELDEARAWLDKAQLEWRTYHAQDEPPAMITNVEAALAAAKLAHKPPALHGDSRSKDREDRMKGVKVSKECMDNPLAKGCM